MIAIAMGALAVVAPVVHLLAGGVGKLSHWVVSVLGLALIVVGFWLRFFADPARRARPLLSGGIFVVGRVTDIMGDLSMGREQYVSVAYEFMGTTCGLGVQGRDLVGVIENGDPVVVLCCAGVPNVAGVLTPTKLLSIGRSYPTAG